MATNYYAHNASVAGATFTTTTTAWTFTAYQEFIPAAYNFDARHISGIEFQFNTVSALDTTVEILLEIATGTAGMESVKMQVPYSVRNDTQADYYFTSTHNIFFPEPMTIAAGQRIAVRMANSGTTAITYSGVKFRYMMEEQPKAATLSDNFDDNSQDTAKWNKLGATIFEQNGRLEISSVLGASGYSSYESKDYYDLSNSSVYAQLTNAGTQTLASWQPIPVRVIYNSANHFAWIVATNTLYAQQQIAGSYTNVRGDLAYNSAVHQYFRIREAGGTVFWDFSTDGVSWTNYTSRAAVWSLSQVLLDISAGAFNAETAVSTAWFDNFNTTATVTPPAANTTNFFQFF